MQLGALLLLALSTTALAAKSKKKCDDVYDYIIVGGGTAGVAVACRLSLGLPSARILLVEAGPSAPDELKITVPGMRGTTLGTKYDWNFTSVAQPHVADRVFSYNRGRVLGGSSALNLMSYDRAAAAEYDAWEELGNPGWNWENMIDAMMRSETFTGRNTDTYGDAGVGDSGPVQAVINRYIPEQQESFIPALNSLGVPSNLESLGGDPLGVMFQPSSIDPGPWNRSYSANSYLPIAGDNLHVVTDTTVAKVNLASAGRSRKRATGITLVDGTVIRANKEVILSAGAIQSPVLLELSGIGSSSVLSAAGIRQLVNLPGVGENLQDHLRVQTSYHLKPGYVSFDNIRANATYAAEQLALYLAGERSAYMYTGSGYAFLTWDQVAADNGTEIKSLAQQVADADAHPVTQKKVSFLNDSAIPQVEIIFSDGYTGAKGYPAATDPLFGTQLFTLIAALMHPLSRGSLHINPSNPSPTANPVINPNFFDNEHDLKAIVEAVKYTRRAASTEPMASLWETPYDPSEVLGEGTDDEWTQFARKTTLSIFHPVGTCSMLPKADGGVVDPQLKVYGTENLRVVDGSIIPLLISAHIQTAIYGIAEIASDIIIADA
ncbi:hypothetical protein jhhlp_004897 [Lomentospora prolificans]|uniref:Glucose-methanol-choline oxidoreductase N-terminal domain-containing protein n=1 Tax=Lomentospora prolificans TaxID=41688 RepID=A0A2N3N822_9PEZI|nr:hypothetical protein jhhlp_007563 [Lomentospora prolificans]PKS08512.1 hypothetical protein jhhlp_004897 [Lomentospora prolificans]